jgi:RNA polymerase sigma factor (sigma-70 family)
MGPGNALEDADGDLPFEELVRSLRAGDAAAWTRVFDRLLPRVQAAVYRAFGSDVARPENAGGQAVASACRSIYRNIVAGRFELNNWSDLAGLFIRIATNKCVDKLRHDQRQVTQSELSSDLDTERGRTAEPSPLDRAIRAETVAEVRCAVDRVRRELGKVNPWYVEVFKLKLEDAYTNEQIAAKVGCSEATVNRAWRHAVRLLRGMLEGHGADHTTR